MKPEERDAASLWDMLRAARDARELLEGRSLAKYLRDRVRQLALERALELVGEPARRVTEGFKSAHPEIEWRSIIGQRNVLAHQYGVIDHERLYRTGTESIPRLIAALRAILEENEPGEP
jgi:uncharacterized protein with HEPN domain